MRHSIDKERLLRIVKNSLLFDKKPVSATYDMLVWAFGFVRKSGEEIMLTQLLLPSRTEEQICMSPKHKVIEDINNWCEEHGFIGDFDWDKDTYFFTCILPKQSI